MRKSTTGYYLAAILVAGALSSPAFGEPKGTRGTAPSAQQAVPYEHRTGYVKPSLVRPQQMNVYSNDGRRVGTISPNRIIPKQWDYKPEGK